MNTCSQIPICHLLFAIRHPPQNPKRNVVISATSEKYSPRKNNKSNPCRAVNISDIITTLKNSFSNVINPPLHPSVNPVHVFKGNLAPVEEMEPTKCEVMEGELPLSLDGVYIRNGPNPQYRARRAQHLFEGDGMLHSLRFLNGEATYCNRYVKTHKFNVEKGAAFPVFPNMLSGLYGLLDVLHFLMYIKTILTGHLDILKGVGLANTSLALVAGKLVALCESDLPYIIELTQKGDIETLGRWEIDRKLFSNMTAHPKLDMETKETFAFSWSFISPHLTFFRMDERGDKQNEVPIFSIRKASFIHDFAITKRYAIFHDTQLVYSLPKVLMGKGSPLVYEPDKSTRIGIIPRYAESDSDMKWFDIPGFNAIHIINAWENGDDEIVMVTTNLKSVENFLHNKKHDFVLDKVKINTKTGRITRNILSDRNLDLGSINKAYTGKKSRYAYVGVLDDTPKTCGLVKIDMETGKEVGKRFYGDGCFGGEPLFVRRKNGEGEDDGYVMTIVHNEHSNESMFLLMDAKSADFSTVAAVKLPRRVPYGFHALFFTNYHNAGLGLE